MKVLLVGVGGVGESIAVRAQDRPWLDKMILADIDPGRAKAVRNRLEERRKYAVEKIDAGDKKNIIELAKKHKVDLIMNAVEPQFNEAVFDATFKYGCTYMDMAMTLAKHHPTDMYNKCGEKLGDYQFAQNEKWEKKRQLALLGMGIDPGASNVFARYAQDHLFDEIEEIGVRDGSNIEVKGYAFAPTFSIWTTIDECLNPPVIWEQSKGWFTTQPFSEPEVFDFPEGIGPVECVNVEHEEVPMIPRYIKCKRVTFKYGLGTEFIGVLKTLHMLALDNKYPIKVKGVQVAPRDVVAACLPNPATLGDSMTGKTCVGTWVKGTKDGKPRQVFIYQSTDNADCMKKYGCQAVVWQTGVNPVIAMELIHEGIWKGAGVVGPEVFDAVPYLRKMIEFDYPYGIKEML